MKLLFASDIHGSAFYCRQLMDAIHRENPDKVVLLGDLLYHGPRNDLPQEYAPKQVIAMLNGIKDRLVCVRGNCEAEVDQMVLGFPCMADYVVLYADNKVIYATHGHIYNQNNLLPMNEGEYLIHGHTHIPVCVEKDGITIMNPGSVSIPKENSWHGYMIFENGEFAWKDLQGNVMTVK
ncbi:MAG: phosphodiesterase [Lachnospiraceae bacterium]